MQILTIYFVYFLMILFLSYYVNLFSTQETFTKEDLKQVFPYLKKFYILIVKKYSFFMFFLIIFIVSLIGIMIPSIITHWIGNSSLIFVAIFLIFPLIKKYLQRSQVTSTENYSDDIANIFVKYIDIIIIGFGAGQATILIINWRELREINSVYFMLNIVIISILLVISIKNMIQEK
jgi:hypothetical protein